MQQIMHFLFVLFALIALIACKSAPIYNFEEVQFSVSKDASLERIKQAIITGSKNAGWETKELQAGKILAAYSTKRNKFGAAVIIDYDLDSYSILYHSSHNLKYNEKIEGESGFLSDSQEFFTEYNPFAKDTSNIGTVQPATIHKIYNTWVSKLEASISNELSLLQLGKNYNTTQTYLPKTPKSTPDSNKRALRIKKNCSDTPDSNIHERARIKSSKANLRSGAGTDCAIVGSLSRGAMITLLGQKGNWHYIQQTNGSNAWVYSALISLETSRTISQTPPDKTEITRVPPPPTPLSKRISIAVIRFKTLNKEAQDIALGDLISETFTTALVNSNNFKIIEREQLDKVVKEMEMTQTGFIESTDAVEIGKMLHADAIITGSVALLNNQIQLNARVIEIESAYVISAESATTHYSLNNINKTISNIVNNLSYKLMSKKK